MQGASGFAYGAVTLFRRPSQAVPLPGPFVTCPELLGASGMRSRDTGRGSAPAL